MANLSDEIGNRRNSREQIWRCTISLICSAFIQLSLLIIPHFFPLLSLLSHFLLSVIVLAIVMGICQYVRRLIGIHASAPAFVLFHLIVVWVVYISVIRQAVSMVLNIVMNAELAILVIGFFRILASDPGFVRHDSPSLAEDPILDDGHHLEEVSSTETGMSLPNPSEVTSLSSRRIRYCRSCKAYVMGFDHHCPAFGNCIGQKNHGLFLLLLGGFVMSESSYAVLSYQWINRKLILKERSSKIHYSLVMSTMNFSLLHVLWQVVFLAWHVYCVCVNIRTEEWINWRKFQEFHVISQPSPDQSFPDFRFRNPYDKGVLCNLKEFFLR